MGNYYEPSVQVDNLIYTREKRIKKETTNCTVIKHVILLLLISNGASLKIIKNKTAYITMDQEAIKLPKKKT
jgi:hypothetical protein